jgi:hypothetical protein
MRTFGAIYPLILDEDILMDHQVMACPVCRNAYSHIREVFTRFGIDPYEGGHPYQGTVGKGVVQDKRRDALVVVFDGECPHAWELVIQQHKGNDCVYVRMVAPRPGMEEESDEPRF